MSARWYQQQTRSRQSVTVQWLEERVSGHLWCCYHRELHSRDMFSASQQQGWARIGRRCLCCPRISHELPMVAPFYVPYDVYAWACKHAQRSPSKAATFDEWAAMPFIESEDPDVLGAHGPPGGMELTWYYLEPIRKHDEDIDFAHLDAKRAVQRLTQQQVEQGAPQREQQARGGAASAVVHEEDSGAGVFPQRSSAVQQQQQQHGRSMHRRATRVGGSRWGA
jgi:hypothetical protein